VAAAEGDSGRFAAARSNAEERDNTRKPLRTRDLDLERVGPFADGEPPRAEPASFEPALSPDFLAGGPNGTRSNLQN